MKNICIIANFEKTYLYSSVLEGIDNKKFFGSLLIKNKKIIYLKQIQERQYFVFT